MTTAPSITQLVSSRASRLLALGLAVLCCASLPLRAQTTPDAPHPTTLRFLFLDETPGAYSLQSGGATRQISSAPYAISSPITVQPRGRLDIFQTASTPDPVTGEKERVKLTSITPPGNLVSALAVITTRPPAEGSTLPTCDVTYFDNDIKAFPTGSVRVINLGRAPMGTQFGKTPPFLLQPGEERIIQPTPDEKNRVVAKVAVSEGEGWRLLANKIVLLRPGQRLTGVFIYSPSGRLHSYTAEELAEFGKPKPGHFWISYIDTIQNE